MINEEDVLNALDHCNDGFYRLFVQLDEPYSYLIDSRLNVFRSDDDRWAIAIERLGYNPRVGCISLDIYYYGNCLINLESYNNRPTNSYNICPVDMKHFNSTVDHLKEEAEFWIISKQKVPLSFDKQEYQDVNIDLDVYGPNQIRVEEAARLLITRNQELFRATDTALYKSIPADLNKILAVDSWYHKDFFCNLLMKCQKIKCEKPMN